MLGSIGMCGEISVCVYTPDLQIWHSLFNREAIIRQRDETSLVAARSLQSNLSTVPRRK